MIVYLNGGFCAEEDARVPITDRSFLFADGCFDAAGVWAGRVIDMDAHVDRFFHSARMMRIEVPVSVEKLRALLVETAARNGMADGTPGSLRFVLSRGAGPAGVNAARQSGPPLLTIMAKKVAFPDPPAGDIPVVRTVVSTYARPDPVAQDPRVKTTAYVTSVLAFLEAADRGADVAILRDSRGFVAEAHTANLFCVRDGAIFVPHRSSGLDGVTRGHVLRVARRLGYACDEAYLTAYDLRTADEAFLTSASSGISAVAAVDGEALPDPVPGPTTTELAREYTKEAYAQGTPIPTSTDGT